MSMILDALQRADRERRKDETPAPALPPVVQPAAPPPGRQGYRRIGLVLLVVVLIGLTVWWFQQESGSTPATVPAAEKNVAPQSSVADQSAPASEPPQPGVERLYEAPSRLPPDESIADLYRRAQAPEETDPAPASEKDSPSQPLPSTPERIAPEPEQAPVARPSVPAIRDLSWSLQQQIPSLNYQAHQYRAEPGQTSTVTINQQEHRAGAQITPDVRIERIDEDGVVLSFKGEPFKLKALNSWVNM